MQQRQTTKSNLTTGCCSAAVDWTGYSVPSVPRKRNCRVAGFSHKRPLLSSTKTQSCWWRREDATGKMARDHLRIGASSILRVQFPSPSPAVKQRTNPVERREK